MVNHIVRSAQPSELPREVQYRRQFSSLRNGVIKVVNRPLECSGNSLVICLVHVNHPMRRPMIQRMTGQFKRLTGDSNVPVQITDLLRRLVRSPLKHPITGQFIGPLMIAIQISLTLLLNRTMNSNQGPLNRPMNMVKCPMNCLVPLKL